MAAKGLCMSQHGGAADRLCLLKIAAQIIFHLNGFFAFPLQSQWISPAPVSVKMRLFCLPYAGGISENVFSR